ADEVGMNFAILSKKSVDLFQFIIDLSSIATSQQRKKIERIVIELEFSFFCALLNPLNSLFFPSASAGIEPVEDLHLRASKQRLIKRTAFIQVGRTDQEHDTGGETAIE